MMRKEDVKQIERCVYGGGWKGSAGQNTERMKKY